MYICPTYLMRRNGMYQCETLVLVHRIEISLLFIGDRPVVVQFAAKNAAELASAAELIAPFSDGVDLNCGCPQRLVC